jgi:hypothetical protein
MNKALSNVTYLSSAAKRDDSWKNGQTVLTIPSENSLRNKFLLNQKSPSVAHSHSKRKP